LNLVLRNQNIHKSWTSKAQSSSGSQEQAAHTTLLCFQQEPELLNSEPAFDSFVVVPAPGIELGTGIRTSQHWFMTHYSSAGRWWCQIVSVSVTSHNPLCAEEMRGSNHFMLACWFWQSK
jgi:hypothetical protein